MIFELKIVNEIDFSPFLTQVTLARLTSTNVHQIPANMTLSAYRVLPPLHATVNQDILEQIVKPILMNVR